MLAIYAMLILLAIPLTSLMINNFSKHKRMIINRMLFICVSFLVVLAAFFVETHLAWIYFVVYLPIMACLGYYIYRLEHQLSVMNSPVEYIAFYFPCLGIVLFTGLCESPFFPEIFLFSLIFVVAHSGRRISFGLGIICAISIITLYWHGVALGIHPFTLNDPILPRILLTIFLMVVIPQLHRYLYTKRLKSMNQAA